METPRSHITFTHEWEKPTGAVIDEFLANHTRPRKMVLVGMSMGGYLAPRAAAFNERFDGVVAYDVCFDLGATSRWLWGKRRKATISATSKTSHSSSAARRIKRSLKICASIRRISISKVCSRRR